MRKGKELCNSLKSLQEVLFVFLAWYLLLSKIECVEMDEMEVKKLVLAADTSIA